MSEPIDYGKLSTDVKLFMAQEIESYLEDPWLDSGTLQINFVSFNDVRRHLEVLGFTMGKPYESSGYCTVSATKDDRHLVVYLWFRVGNVEVICQDEDPDAEDDYNDDYDEEYDDEESELDHKGNPVE